MSRVVSQEDVLLHIYAFLESCGYSRTVLALQAESGVPYNVIHSVSQAPSGRRAAGAPRSAQGLESAVLEGDWFTVLSQYVDGLLLPQDVKEILYETIFDELLELHGLREAARALLSHSPVFKEMKSRSPARYARLEGVLQHFNAAAVEERAAVRAATPAEVQSKRDLVLRQLLAHVHFSSEPYDGFLPAALAARRATDSNTTDTASGTTPPPTRASKRTREEEEGEEAGTGADGSYRAMDRLHRTTAHPVEAPAHVLKKVSFGDDTLVACCATLPATASSAALAVLGRANGLVDFVDPSTGLAVGASVSHTAGVLSLTTDRPQGDQPAWVAVGYRDGTVKVYNAESRKLVRRFPTVHSLGVTSLAFLESPTEEGLGGHQGLLVSGSFDTTMHVLSLATGASLCHLRGSHHDAFVNAMCALQAPPRSISNDSSFFLSAGNDGTLCAWQVQRSQQSGSSARCQRLVDGTCTLQSLFKPAGEAVATSLLAITTDGPHTEGTASSEATEVVVLTRSNLVLILSVACRRQDDNGSVDALWAFTPTVLYAIDTHHSVRHGAFLVTTSPTLSFPMLSLYVTDEDGTVLLYNVEMAWRDAEQWARHGGVQRLTYSALQSAAVVSDVGEGVHDLRLACFPQSPASAKVRLVACSPSLPCVYVLE